MVDGAFDPLHLGHIEYFRAAAQLDVPLLCNVASDAYVSTKHPPLLPEHQRAAIVDAIRYISYTYINRSTRKRSCKNCVRDYYVKGKDWEGRLPPEQVSICARARHRDRLPRHGASTRRAASSTSSCPGSTSHDEHYRVRAAGSDTAPGRIRRTTTTSTSPATGATRATTTAWRRGARSRRRTPSSSKRCFSRRRSSTSGCGPGALMHLLWELGVDVDGIDFADSSKAAGDAGSARPHHRRLRDRLLAEARRRRTTLSCAAKCSST